MCVCVCVRLKWDISEVEEDVRDATSSLSAMIQDSDLLSHLMGYGKAVPKKFKLSPDGWFQVQREWCGLDMGRS